MSENEVAQSPESTTEGSEPQQDLGTSNTEQPDLLDLASVERFKIGEKEWTLEDLQKSILLHSDYTKKTQAIAEERKYNDALLGDLEKVKANPALAAEFKSVYPEKFHRFLGYVSNGTAQAQQGSKEQSPQLTIPPEVQDKFQKVDQFLAKAKEAEVKGLMAEIDATFSKLGDKYPLAKKFENAIIAEAQSLIKDGQELNDKVWDRLWKNYHDSVIQASEEHYSGLVKKQSSSNAKGRDSGTGGGIVGQAPKVPKNIKESGEMFREHIEGLS